MQIFLINWKPCNALNNQHKSYIHTFTYTLYLTIYDSLLRNCVLSHSIANVLFSLLYKCFFFQSSVFTFTFIYAQNIIRIKYYCSFHILSLNPLIFMWFYLETYVCWLPRSSHPSDGPFFINTHNIHNTVSASQREWNILFAFLEMKPVLFFNLNLYVYKKKLNNL